MNKDEALKMAIEAFYAFMDEKITDEDFKFIQWKACQACKKALEQPISLGDFNRMSKAECVDYIEYLRKEIDLLTFKKWQGLTDDEIDEMAKEFELCEMGLLIYRGMVRTIEAKLKDKNT